MCKKSKIVSKYLIIRIVISNYFDNSEYFMWTETYLVLYKSLCVIDSFNENPHENPDTCESHDMLGLHIHVLYYLFELV